MHPEGPARQHHAGRHLSGLGKIVTRRHHRAARGAVRVSQADHDRAGSLQTVLGEQARRGPARQRNRPDLGLHGGDDVTRRSPRGEYEGEVRLSRPEAGAGDRRRLDHRPHGVGLR